MSALKPSSRCFSLFRLPGFDKEADYNLFNIAEAERVELSELSELSKELHLAEPNMVVIVMSNDDSRATTAWKALVAESVPNVYILEGGINGLLDVFHEDEIGIEQAKGYIGTDELGYMFAAALGGSFEASDPDFNHIENHILYTPKIKLELKRGPSSGGCGCKPQTVCHSIPGDLPPDIFIYNFWVGE